MSLLGLNQAATIVVVVRLWTFVRYQHVYYLGNKFEILTGFRVDTLQMLAQRPLHVLAGGGPGQVTGPDGVQWPAGQ